MTRPRYRPPPYPTHQYVRHPRLAGECTCLLPKANWRHAEPLLVDDITDVGAVRQTFRGAAERMPAAEKAKAHDLVDQAIRLVAVRHCTSASFGPAAVLDLLPGMPALLVLGRLRTFEAADEITATGATAPSPWDDSTARIVPLYRPGPRLRPVPGLTAPQPVPDAHMTTGSPA